jgi:hypothetical protein
MIMKFKYYYMLLGILLMVSCSKDIVTNLESPTFDVTVLNTTVKAGQPVTFYFTGNAHTISFYSGETLKDYNFKDGRVIDVTGAGATMEFTTSQQITTPTPTWQTNQFSILASNNFNGDYSSLDKVKAATWTDITSRFTLSPGTSTAFTPSSAANTKVDISDLLSSDVKKPIYIAFKYVTQPQATNGLARQWYVQTFAIKSKDSLASTVSTTPIALTLADQIYAGFRIVDNSPTTNLAQSAVTTTRLTLWGNEYRYATLQQKYDSTLAKWNKKDPMYDPNSPLYVASAVWTPYVPFVPGAPDNDPASENWAVSAPIYLTTVNLGPDYSTAIKAGIASSALTTYPYTYAKPGTYLAYFVGFNASIEQTKTKIDSIYINVIP